MNTLTLRRMVLLAMIPFAISRLHVNAQAVKVVYDDQKEKQWKSMEIGPWEFAPSWYYALLHENYSGAETYWHWAGFKSGYRVRFKEEKSNVKTINPTRLISELTQEQKLKKVETERSLIEELYKEDLVKQADRMIDVSYEIYRKDFNQMQDLISEGLVYCLKKSNGNVQRQVDDITRRNEIICSKIDYIHKTGIGYELENSKRQRAYEEAKQEMATITRMTVKLTALVMAVY